MRGRSWWWTLIIVVALVGPAPTLSSARPTSPSENQSGPALSCPSPDPDIDYLCPEGPDYLLPGLSDTNGWTDRENAANLRYGDLDGDGADELVARGSLGTAVYRFDTASGQWSQVKVAPILPDDDIWSQPQYYRTLQLGDIDGDRKSELVIRSPQGVVVFAYVQVTKDTASWKQLSTSGPLADSSAWASSPSYYATMQLVETGTPAGSTRRNLLARSGAGLVLYSWTGTGWQQLAAETTLSDANGFTDVAAYSTIQAQGSHVIARGRHGLVLLTYAPDRRTFDPVVSPLMRDTDDFDQPRYYRTLHPVRIGLPDPTVMAREADGLQFWHWTAGTGWTPVLTTPIADLAVSQPGWADESSYATLQPADLDGDGLDEIVGRNSAGVAVYRVDGTRRTFQGPLSPGVPALTDGSVWQQTTYASTLTTARLDPTSPSHSLLVRGPYGVRTWRWDQAGASFTRWHLYGSFPVLDTTVLAAVTRFVGIESGTIRDVYTDPGQDTSSTELGRLLTTLQQNCTGSDGGTPVRYATCAPPAGSGVPVAIWTLTVNQLVAELTWATAVLDHFTGLGAIQAKLFTDENSELPSIEADLRLGQSAADVVTQGLDLLDLFGTVADVLGAIAGEVEAEDAAFVLELTSSALGVTANATAAVSGAGGPKEIDQTLGEVHDSIAHLQQQQQSTLDRHQRVVLGDYGQLATVGHLVASRIWTLNETGALSASRQGFTRWVYQQLLPVLWTHWSVTGCVAGAWYAGECYPPNPGPVVTVTDVGVLEPAYDIDGLFTNTRPCSRSGVVLSCQWVNPSDNGWEGTVTTVAGPLTAACTWNGTTNSPVWSYGECSLGVSLSELLTQWSIPQYACVDNTYQGFGDQPNGSRCLEVQPVGAERGSLRSTPRGGGSVTLRASTTVPGGFRLARASVEIHALVRENAQHNELVNVAAGTDAFPVSTTVRSAGRHRATFSARRPQLNGELRLDGRRLRIDVQVPATDLDVAIGCGVHGRALLSTLLVVRDQAGRTGQVLQDAHWTCRTDRAGRTTGLTLR